MTEAQTIQWLNSRKNSTAKLRLVNDPYSTYDAEDSERIVESQLKNKTFLYVVIDTKGLYVFNISDIIGMITVQPPVAIQMPRTTAFKKKRKIIKYVYNLAEKLCCYYAARIDE